MFYYVAVERVIMASLQTVLTAFNFERNVAILFQHFSMVPLLIKDDNYTLTALAVAVSQCTLKLASP